MKFLRNPIVTGILAVVAVAVVIYQFTGSNIHFNLGGRAAQVVASIAPAIIPPPVSVSTPAPTQIAEATNSAPDPTIDSAYLEARFAKWVASPLRDPFLLFGGDKEKSKEEYRNYEAPARDSVREFYRLNHTYQTYDFVQQKRAEFLKFDKKEMSVWAAFDFLNQLVDDSDPYTDLDQFQHLLQTSEAIRADGHPDWMVLAGLFHDMGKVLCLFDEPQWAVVGDTRW